MLKGSPLRILTFLWVAGEGGDNGNLDVDGVDASGDDDEDDGDDGDGDDGDDDDG